VPVCVHGQLDLVRVLKPAFHDTDTDTDTEIISRKSRVSDERM